MSQIKERGERIDQHISDWRPRHACKQRTSISLKPGQVENGQPDGGHVQSPSCQQTPGLERGQATPRSPAAKAPPRAEAPPSGPRLADPPKRHFRSGVAQAVSSCFVGLRVAVFSKSEACWAGDALPFPCPKMTASLRPRAAPPRRPFSSWSSAGILMVTLALRFPAPTGRGLGRGALRERAAAGWGAGRLETLLSFGERGVICGLSTGGGGS